MSGLVDILEGALIFGAYIAIVAVGLAWTIFLPSIGLLWLFGWLS